MKIFYPKYKREDLVEKLKRIFVDISRTINIKDARLFGSFAKGNNTAFSDIDIFVVVGDNQGKNVYSILSMITIALYTHAMYIINNKSRRSPEPVTYIQKDASCLCT